jgi:hypothetical protein
MMGAGAMGPAGFLGGMFHGLMDGMLQTMAMGGMGRQGMQMMAQQQQQQQGAVPGAAQPAQQPDVMPAAMQPPAMQHAAQLAGMLGQQGMQPVQAPPGVLAAGLHMGLMPLPGGMLPGMMPGMLQQGAAAGAGMGQQMVMIPLGGGQVLFPGPQAPEAQQQQHPDGHVQHEEQRQDHDG